MKVAVHPGSAPARSVLMAYAATSLAMGNARHATSPPATVRVPRVQRPVPTSPAQVMGASAGGVAMELLRTGRLACTLPTLPYVGPEQAATAAPIRQVPLSSATVPVSVMLPRSRTALLIRATVRCVARVARRGRGYVEVRASTYSVTQPIVADPVRRARAPHRSATQAVVCSVRWAATARPLVMVRARCALPIAPASAIRRVPVTYSTIPGSTDLFPVGHSEIVLPGHVRLRSSIIRVTTIMNPVLDRVPST